MTAAEEVAHTIVNIIVHGPVRKDLSPMAEIIGPASQNHIETVTHFRPGCQMATIQTVSHFLPHPSQALLRRPRSQISSASAKSARTSARPGPICASGRHLINPPRGASSPMPAGINATTIVECDKDCGNETTIVPESVLHRYVSGPFSTKMASV